MLFWIAATLLTILALAFVLTPLMRGQRAPKDADLDLALYHSQMAAIADEVAAGRIQPDDAEATRTETKRRLLAAERRRPGQASASPGARAGTYRIAALAIGGLVPLLALALYVAGGRPDLPDRPFAEREAERAAAGVPSTQERALVQELAGQMARDGRDPQGWFLLAQAYLRQGRYDEAVNAYDNADARKPSDGEILSSRGEAKVLQAGGEITEDALADFDAAAKAQPDNVRARYFVALARAQAGDYENAIAGWSALLQETPKDSPLRALLEDQIGQAQAARTGLIQLGPEITSDAERLSPQERQIMIRRMVDGLAARLMSEPKDLEGWLRLARSYMVLGETEKAAGALAQASEHFKEDAAAHERIERARAALPAVSPGGFPAETP